MLRKTKAPKVRVLRAGERYEVWLYRFGRRRLTGSVNVHLASDAAKRGQDLVSELVDQSLREADRLSATA
ncbi:MAG TPA: hypothetical protein VEC14_14380 [Reyranellaceae bacterium]|nr:hypothetical protein [Reyranellaceae bacterium]